MGEPVRPRASAWALQTYACGDESKHRGEEEGMKEIADEFMKLLAVIMVLVTLAVSTAAFSSMFG
jgi:hypothetical protein